MIKDSINQQIADALRKHDDLRLTTLRMLSSALNYEFIGKQHTLSEEEEIVVVRREIKKRNDSVLAYKAVLKNDPAHVQEKIDKELSEIEILKVYLPPEMSENELSELVKKAIEETGATEIKDMGKVIGIVKGKTGGAVDGSKIAEFVKKALVTGD
jgi:uncharacterized protein